VKAKVGLSELHLCNKTYPVFFVSVPYEPRSSHTDSYFIPLYANVCKANGQWPYAFVSKDDGFIVSVGCPKAGGTLVIDGPEDFSG
jgi:hypothetical protein